MEGIWSLLMSVIVLFFVLVINNMYVFMLRCYPCIYICFLVWSYIILLSLKYTFVTVITQRYEFVCIYLFVPNIYNCCHTRLSLFLEGYVCAGILCQYDSGNNISLKLLCIHPYIFICQLKRKNR